MANTTKRQAAFVWIDCEVAFHPEGKRLFPSQVSRANLAVSCSPTGPSCQMTGLNTDTDVIIEIFCLVTDSQLNLLDETGWGTVVHQTKERMDAMDEWCTRVHGESGLTAAVIESTVTPDQAADGLLAYVTKWAPKARSALLAGNSVHADLAFLRKEPYKKVIDHLHYRILDVSSIKEATRSWRPDLAAAAPSKKGLHKARDDILESIEEARYYKSAVFHAPDA